MVDAIYMGDNFTNAYGKNAFGDPEVMKFQFEVNDQEI